MDSYASTDPRSIDLRGPAHAVLAEVTCSWLGEEQSADDVESAPVLPPPVVALVLHTGEEMLVLEAANPLNALPPVGTLVRVGNDTFNHLGRLAEQGRGGRFLVCLGSRAVRRSVRLRVSLPGVLRSSSLAEPRQVEIVDLTTGGARVRGIELPINSTVMLEFTPPGRDASVTVRALVAHGTQGAAKPWIGLIFHLVAMRGGR